MKNRLLIFLSTLIVSGFLFSACDGGQTEDKQEKFTGNLKISGAEILQDARDYADIQCQILRKQLQLENDPDVKDFELKKKELKMEKNKARNFYRKKYNGMPEEWRAFQRAVKAARQDSKFCEDLPKKQIRL